MSFFRHQEIYRSDVGRRDERIAAPYHRCDEFPAGYSLAGCSPAEPASASPANPSLGGPVSCDNCFAVNGDVSLISLSHFGAPPQAATLKFPTRDCPTCQNIGVLSVGRLVTVCDICFATVARCTATLRISLQSQALHL